MEEREFELDLRDIIKLLLDKWYLIVVSFFVLTLVAALYSYVILDDTYTAETTILVLTESEVPIDQSSFTLGQNLVDTYTELATSRTVLQITQSRLSEDISINALSNMIQVGGVSNTIVINLSVETTDPLLSADIANYTALAMQEASTMFEGFDNLEILDEALPPLNPSGPNRLLYTAIGAILGLMIGVFGIFMIEFFDQRVKGVKDLEKIDQLRILGVISYYDTSKTSERVA